MRTCLRELEEMCITYNYWWMLTGTHYFNSVKELKPPEATKPEYNQLHKSLVPILDLMTTPKPDELSDVIVLNSFEFEDNLGPTNTSANLCKGYTFTFSDEKSPHTSYPFALHDTLVPSWDYSLRNGIIALFSQACLMFIHEGGKSCRPCQLLWENKILEKNSHLNQWRVHGNAGYAYYGFLALSEVLCCKTQQLCISDFQGIN